MRNVPVTLISRIRRKEEAGNLVEGPLRDRPAQDTKPFGGYRNVDMNILNMACTAFYVQGVV